VVVVRTQILLSPAARGSGTNAKFLSPDARGSGAHGIVTNAKFSQDQPRVVVVRTQNFLSPALSGSGTHGC